MATIRDCLARSGLEGDTAGADAEVLLGHCLRKPRAYLHAWPEREVSAAQALCFAGLADARRGGEPVAYLVGEREFWSLPLKVDRHTAIPRPETETLVEWALELDLPEAARIADWGTGSGAVALALAAERPAWEVWATDTDPDALAVAAENARRLGLETVIIRLSHWGRELRSERFDCIVSNPPYVAKGDPHLKEGDLRFEPRLALSAGGDGLDAIREIAASAGNYLNGDSWLLLEHGFDQGPAVRELLKSAGFRRVETRRDLAGRERVSGGQWRAQ